MNCDGYLGTLNLWRDQMEREHETLTKPPTTTYADEWRLLVSQRGQQLLLGWKTERQGFPFLTF